MLFWRLYITVSNTPTHVSWRRAGNACRREVQQILHSGEVIGRFDNDIINRCEREFQEVLRINGGQSELLISSLEAFFNSQESEDRMDFEAVRRQIYSKSYYPIAEHLIYAFPYGQKRAETVLEYCGKVLASTPHSARILDIGTGPGVIARRLCEHSENLVVDVLDVSEACLDYARRVLGGRSNVGEHISGDFLDFVPGRPYDLIIASEVIEHVADPETALRHVRSFLPLDGALVLGVPILLPMTMHLTVFSDIEEVLSMVERVNFTVVDGHIYPLYGDSVDLTLLLVGS